MFLTVINVVYQDSGETQALFFFFIPTNWLPTVVIDFPLSAEDFEDTPAALRPRNENLVGAFLNCHMSILAEISDKSKLYFTFSCIFGERVEGQGK